MSVQLKCAIEAYTSRPAGRGAAEHFTMKFKIDTITCAN